MAQPRTRIVTDEFEGVLLLDAADAPVWDWQESTPDVLSSLVKIPLHIQVCRNGVDLPLPR